MVAIAIAYSYHKVILDDQGIPCGYVFLEVNNEYENTMDLCASDIVGKRHSAVFIKEWQEADRLNKACLDALTNHKTVSIDLPNDTIQKWFRVRIVPVNANYFFCIFIDVTKEYLQKQEIEGFLRTNLDMLCVADKYGNLIKVNKQFENELGYGAKELEGKGVLSFVHKDDLSKTIKEFLNKSLEYVIEFTGSELGYIFLYDVKKEEFPLNSCL